MKGSFLKECETLDAAGQLQYEFCLVEFEVSKPIRNWNEPSEGGAIEGLKVFSEAGALIKPCPFDLKYIEDEIFTNQIPQLFFYN